MRRLLYILPILLSFFYISCSDDTDALPEKSEGKTVSIKLMQQPGFVGRIIDNDNLASEQTVKNISVFFTEPSSDVVTNKFVFLRFASVDDYKLVPLPLNPETLHTKDIYVITNYDNVSTLNAVATVSDIQNLTTPAVDKTNNLTPENGICMYGVTYGFNFNDGTYSPAVVNVERTGAKMRVNVTFPENPTLSTNNTFLIQNAARYTYVVKNDTLEIPQTGYYTYAAAMPLTNNGSGVYSGIAYIYAATQAPKLYIYTNMGGKKQEFSADLPKPQRNYLYDIDIEVYSGTVPPGTKSIGTSNDGQGYYYKTSVSVYDADGNRIS